LNFDSVGFKKLALFENQNMKIENLVVIDKFRMLENRILIRRCSGMCIVFLTSIFAIWLGTGCGEEAKKKAPPPGWPPRPNEYDFESGPVGEAKRLVKKIEAKITKNETILKSAQIDKDDLTARLRSAGVSSVADLKGNIRGQTIAGNLFILVKEIEGIERQLALLETELLKAKSLVRRLQQQEAGLSASEKTALLQKLTEAEERTNNTQLPSTPLEIDAVIGNILKANPKPKK
jgi:hypothetical protein